MTGTGIFALKDAGYKTCEINYLRKSYLQQPLFRTSEHIPLRRHKNVCQWSSNYCGALAA
jgi:hypothetical protein